VSVDCHCPFRDTPCHSDDRGFSAVIWNHSPLPGTGTSGSLIGGTCNDEMRCNDHAGPRAACRAGLRARRAAF
jgi:hypothetical protein